MFNLQADKSRPDILEMKSESSNGADAIPPGGFKPGFSLQKPWTAHTRVFQAFSSAMRKNTSFYLTGTLW